MRDSAVDVEGRGRVDCTREEEGGAVGAGAGACGASVGGLVDLVSFDFALGFFKDKEESEGVGPGADLFFLLLFGFVEVEAGPPKERVVCFVVFFREFFSVGLEKPQASQDFDVLSNVHLGQFHVLSSILSSILSSMREK